jgi:hypothetical protein
VPRNYDSDEQAKTGAKLTFSANIDCPECDTVFEGLWVDDAIDVEQLVDPPVNYQSCPNTKCGHRWEEEYPGFFNYSDAG